MYSVTIKFFSITSIWIDSVKEAAILHILWFSQFIANAFWHHLQTYSLWDKRCSKHFILTCAILWTSLLADWTVVHQRLHSSAMFEHHFDRRHSCLNVWAQQLVCIITERLQHSFISWFIQFIPVIPTFDSIRPIPMY